MLVKASEGFDHGGAFLGVCQLSSLNNVFCSRSEDMNAWKPLNCGHWKNDHCFMYCL